MGVPRWPGACTSTTTRRSRLSMCKHNYKEIKTLRTSEMNMKGGKKHKLKILSTMHTVSGSTHSPSYVYLDLISGYPHFLALKETKD
jgi:hypothetical protein